jgi:hypothetical protein
MDDIFEPASGGRWPTAGAVMVCDDDDMTGRLVAVGG